MLYLSRYAARAVRSAAILLSVAALSHAAVITVSSVVTNLGSGLYNYSYSISNSGVDDAFLIDIDAPANSGAVTNLMTPAGFTSQFDSGLGLVSFLENTSDFTSTPTSGFSFNSPDAPGADPFVASLVSSSTGNLFTISGSTTGPIAAASAAPEPGSIYLLALLVPISLYARRRKVGCAASSLETTNEMGMTHVTKS